MLFCAASGLVPFKRAWLIRRQPAQRSASLWREGHQYVLMSGSLPSSRSRPTSRCSHRSAGQPASAFLHGAFLAGPLGATAIFCAGTALILCSASSIASRILDERDFMVELPVDQRQAARR